MADDKQLEMFDDGGLMDEGGSVDPVSGNEVPSGSTQKEVRDDIPAQLSEGEFVLPADVVRYHGLEKIMQLRDEAKQGLQKMEDMGQMGNADEAILPDDVPFDLDDLDMEDDGVQEFQVGGMVQPYGTVQGNAGIVQTPSMFANYAQQPAVNQAFTPFGTQAPSTGISGVGQYRPVYQQQPPQQGQQGQQLTFQQLMPTVGGQSETREYRNEAGQIMFIPFVNNQPVYPIPEGYKEYKPEDIAQVEQPTDSVQPTTVTRPDDTKSSSDSGPTDVEVSSAQLSSTRNNLGVTGSRGGNLGTALTALGLVVNPMGALAGLAGKGIAKSIGLDIPNPLENVTLGAAEPKGELSAEQQAARSLAQTVTGQEVSGYVGTQLGDIDPVTGGMFGPQGVALDTSTGFAALTPNGTKSFNSVNTAKGFMSAAMPTGLGGTGYYGGIPDAQTFSRLSPQGKQNLAGYLSSVSSSMGTGLVSGSTVEAIAIAHAPPIDTSNMSAMDKVNALAQDSLARKEAKKTLQTAMTQHALNENMTANTSLSASANTVIGDILAGNTTAGKAMQESGISVSDFSSATNAAIAGVGYSSYDDDGNPTGAAPKGSGYSKTGKFSTGRSGGSSGVSVGFGAGQVDPGLAAAAGLSDTSGVGISSQNALGGGANTGVESADASAGNDGASGCVIATHGTTTGGFSLMEKAKAELWCERTYHGKWYGEAFRRGYRYHGNKAIQKGTAQKHYQEFKDFVAYGRGIKSGYKLGLNYYLRTAQFFITGLFVK